MGLQCMRYPVIVHKAKQLYHFNLFHCTLKRMICNFDFQGCEIPSYVSDGYCDDHTNTGECNYDGGDCCGSNVNTLYCAECLCYEDLNCAAPLELIGNGHCNDETNNANCNYDGGDCCGTCANTEYCSDCLCHARSPTLGCKYLLDPIT